MSKWTCSKCGEVVGPQFDTCWNCGTHRDGSGADPNFIRDDAPAADRGHAMARDLQCLRCKGTMKVIGRKRFHEGSQALPFLLGNLGELFVNRESFYVYACRSCGKVEFFATSPGLKQRDA